MGWREDLAAEMAATSSAPQGASWRDALAAEMAAAELPTPALNLTAAPPEPSLSDGSQDAIPPIPGSPANRPNAIYTKRPGAAPSLTSADATRAAQPEPPVYNPGELRQGKIPGWFDRWTAPGGKRAEMTQATIARTDLDLDKIETRKPGFINDFRTSFDLGNKGVDADRWMVDAAATGDKDLIGWSKGQSERIGKLQEEIGKRHTGIVDKLAHDLAGMSGPMARSIATNLVPLGIGKFASFRYWMDQGSGEFLNQVAEEDEGSYDPAKAQGMAAAVGAAYAGVEMLQLDRLAKLGIGKKVFGGIKNKIVKAAVKILKEGTIQTAEEGLQRLVTETGTVIETAAQGSDVKTWEAIRRIGRAFIDEVKNVALAMYATAGIAGAFGGGNQIRKSASQQKQQNAPFISAAVDGKEIRDVETGEVFTPKPGAKRDDIRGAVRGWLRKHGNVEVVSAEEEAQEEVADVLPEDDFNPTFEEILEEEFPETPPETQENTPPSASDVEVEEVSTQPEESAPGATEQAENKAEAPIVNSRKWGAEPIDAIVAKVEDAKDNVSDEQIQRFQKGASAEEAVTKLRQQIENNGTIGSSGSKELSVTNVETGETAKITANSVGKMVSGKATAKSIANGFTGGQHMAAVSDIEDLFRNATRAGAHPDKYPDKQGRSANVIAINRYVSPIHEDDAAYITEKITVEGNRIYSLELIKMAAFGNKVAEIEQSNSVPVPNPVKVKEVVGKVETGGGQVLNMAAKTPQRTPEAPHAATSDTDKISNPAPEVNKKIKKVSEPSKEGDLLDVLDGVPGDLIYGDATVKELTNEVYRMRKEMGAKYLEQEKPVPKRVKDKYFQLEERLEQRKREIAADYHSSAKPSADVTDSDAVPEDQEALRAAERDAGAVAEEADDTDADEEEAPAKRTKKAKTVEADDIDILSGYEDKRTRKYITPHSYKARKFELRHETRRAIGGSVYETTGGKDVHIGEAQDLDEASELMAAHINKTPEQTKNRTKMKSMGRGERGYYDSELHVGRGDGGVEYSKDKFAEDGGEDYINGGDSREAEQQERTDKAEMYKKGMGRYEARNKLFGQLGESKELVLRTDDGGEEARLSRSSVRKMTSDAAVEKSIANGFSAEQHYAVASDIISLFEASIKLFDHADKKGDANVKAMHRFAAPLNIGDAVAYITVKESAEHGKTMYSVEAIEMEKLAGIIRELYEESPRLSPSARASLKDNINKLRAAVNKNNKKYSSGSSEASSDPFADTPKAAPQASDLRPVEMPELVDMVKKLLGKTPKIASKKKLKGSYGLAVRDKNNNWVDIVLDAGLPKDLSQALKTLAHEIGHIMAKYGGTGKYLAVVQKIKNAVDTLKQFMEDDPGAVNLTPKDRKRIRKEAEDLLRKGEEWIDEVITQETPYTPQEIIDIWNSVDGAAKSPELNEYIARLDSAQKKAVIVAAMKGSVPAGVPTKTQTVATGRQIPVQKNGKATPAEIAAKYKEMILKEAELRRLTEVKTIYDELYALSKKWRPFEEGRDPPHDKYRKKGEEVFADAISVYLNDPAMLEAEAPNFWRVFHGWEGERNPFTDVYEAIQELYGKGGEEAVYNRRNGYLLRGAEREKERNEKNAEKAVADEKARRKRPGGGTWEYVKRKIQSKSAKLGAIERELRKRGIDIKHEDKATVSASDRNYAQSAIKEYTETVIQNVGKALGGWDSDGWGTITKDGVTRDLCAREALHLYMAAKRMATERSKIANLLDKESAERQLAGQKKKIGDKKYAQLEAAAKEFNRINQELIVPELERSGAFGEELLDYVKNNENYARFEVVFDGDEKAHDGSYKVVAIHKQVGSFYDIGDVVINTIKTHIGLLDFAKQNRHKINTINELKMKEVQEMGFTIKDAEKVYGTNKYMNLPADHKTLQTIHVSEGGQHKAYNVDKDIAKILSVPSADHSAFMKVLSVTGQISRGVFINYNPEFQTKNPFRDVLETVLKNPGIVIKGGFLQKLPDAFKRAWRYNRKRELTDSTRKMLRHGAINDGVYNLRNKNTGEFSFENDLAPMSLGAQERLAARKARTFAKLWDAVASPFVAAHEGYSDFTASLEFMTKFAGYEALREAHPEWSERELAYKVRKLVGTPDALEGGEWTPVLNNLIPFSNVNLQGLATTMEISKLRGAIFIAFELLMQVPAFLAAKGLLAVVMKALGWGDDAAKDATEAYNETISYYKKKYYVFPAPWKAKDGTPYIFTFPKSFFAEFASTVAYLGFKSIKEKKVLSDGLFDAAGDLIPYSSQGLQPIVQVAWAYIEWLTGKNPEDAFRDREIIPKKVYGAGKADELPYMLGWTAEKIGGTFGPKTVEGIRDYATGRKNFDKPLLDNILEFPGLGRIPGVFIRRADGGVREEKREAAAAKQQSKKQAAAKKDREKWVSDWTPQERK